MSNVMVTGGSGFIGSNLVRRLLKEGHTVKVLDNVSTGRSQNLEPLLERIELVKGDIRDSETVRKACKGMDYVLHQAALASVPRSVKDPVSSTQSNVIGSLNVMNAARKEDVKRVVFASSSSVYGDTEVLPKREDMMPSPLSPYAVTKVAMEYYFKAFENVYGLKSIGLRYFNVYGPWQSPESEYAAVIPKFIKAVLSGGTPVIYGDGEQTRDFSFVEDVVDANMLAMKNDKIGFDVFNIGNGGAISINKLLEEICSVIGKDSKAEYRDPREGDIKDSLADITRARERLGFDPKYDIKRGLEETINWFRENSDV